MRKALILDSVANTFFLTLLGLAIFIGLTEDHLFFHSQPAAIVQFLCIAGLVVGLPLTCVLLAGTLAVRREIPEGLPPFLLTLGFGLTLFGFVMFGLDVVFRIESLVWFGLSAAVVLGVSMTLVFGRLREQLRLGPLQAVSRVAFVVVCCVALFVGIRQTTRTSGSDRAGTRNVIVVVVDALSADLLSTFNAEAETPDFDEISRVSRHYDEVRTNYADTFGFFGILYSGRKDRQADRTGLLGSLADHGVNVRWLTFHNNGIPRGKANEVGLRGGFITQHFAPLLRAAGIDYNIFWYRRPEFRGKFMSMRESWVTHYANSVQEEKDLFGDVAVAEVENLRRYRDPFFLLLHTNTSAMVETPKGLWESGDVSRTEEEAAIQEMVEADYTYSPRHEPFLPRMRHEVELRSRAGLERLREFFDEYVERGWDRDTLMIVTADHGSLNYERGLAWYAFHHDEEVSRVPLVVAGPGMAGRDDHYRETTDITQTILEVFGIDEKLYPGAVSLFDTPPADRVVTTLTRGSKVRDERFLGVYHRGYKYLFNLYDEDDVRKLEVRGFELVPVAGARPTRDDLPFDLEAILDDYRLE